MVGTIAKDHDAKRQHILRIAAEVFARDGIARASMNEVARACGISKANIYHYYASKDDLIFGILDSYLAALHHWIMDVDLQGLTPAMQLQALTRETLLAYDGMDNEHKIQAEGLPLLPAPQQQVLKNYQRDIVARFADVLQANAPLTLGRNKAMCRDVTMSVFGMLNWFYMWHPKASQEGRIAYAKLVADLTLGGVADKAEQ